MTSKLMFTHRSKEVQITTVLAPQDQNGNTRYDLLVIVDGEQFREPIKGYRKVKAGYRTQIGAHGYDMKDMLNDLKEAVCKLLDEQAPAPATEPRRSNSKDATHLIRDHIKECLTEDYTEVLSEQLDNTCKAFMNWYSPYERRRTPNLQKAFQEWLMCLPSDLSVEYYTYKQAAKLAEWMGAKTVNYTEDVVSQRYCAIIFREFNKMCTLEGVETLFTRL